MIYKTNKNAAEANDEIRKPLLLLNEKSIDIEVNEQHKCRKTRACFVECKNWKLFIALCFSTLVYLLYVYMTIDSQRRNHFYHYINMKNITHETKGN